MANFYADNPDLQYYVERGLDWSPIVELTEFLYRAKDAFDGPDDAVDYYKEILALVGQFVAEEIAPHAEEIDRAGVSLVDGEAVLPPVQEQIFKKIRELELHGMCLPRELGGQNCPLVLYMINTELFARADVAVTAHHGFHGGMALAMLVFSIREGTTEFDEKTATLISTRFADEIEEIRRGDAWGCMDITEPDAGSDMAALRCKGEQDEDGNWFVTGQKIFITSGHGKYHFVIARTEAAGDPDDPLAGLRGLSMFLVPTYEESDDGSRERTVPIVRLEEKLGHHGSATAALSFERAPAQLIGQRGEGFQYMLTLMNNARVGVGFESIGLCETVLRYAKEYAADRRSMGKSIDQHELIADMIDEMESDIIGLRALAMHAVWHEEMAQKIGLLERTGAFAGDPTAEAYLRRLPEHKWESRRVTPLLKFLAAEKSVEMARRCVQIHGGVGYTRDYAAERLLRDAMVFPIYEGTSQIQSLMAMKDTLGRIIKDPQGFVRDAAQARIRSISARDPMSRRLARLQVLSYSAQQHLIGKTVADKYRSLRDKPITEWPQRFVNNWNPKRDFAYAMLHAERLTRLLSDVAICEVLYSQARRHADRQPHFWRYIERAEPRARFLHDEITTTGARLLASLGGGERSQSAAG